MKISDGVRGMVVNGGTVLVDGVREEVVSVLAEGRYLVVIIKGAVFGGG